MPPTLNGGIKMLCTEKRGNASFELRSKTEGEKNRKRAKKTERGKKGDVVLFCTVLGEGDLACSLGMPLSATAVAVDFTRRWTWKPASKCC